MFGEQFPVDDMNINFSLVYIIIHYVLSVNNRQLQIIQSMFFPYWSGLIFKTAFILKELPICWIKVKLNLQFGTFSAADTKDAFFQPNQ